MNLLNYLDRNVIFALFEPIKRDLALTDTQLGWLGSAYILVFSVAALPLGVLSDLRSRRAVIAGGVAVWSAFTFLGGLARGFWQLFACRAAVGIGEAAFAPAASSLVADFYPGKGRAAAMGILQSGLAFGGVLGIMLGGFLGHHYGWRVALMAVGLPGFLCALLVSRLADPTRTHRPVRLTPLVIERGLERFALQFHPLLLGTLLGSLAATVLHLRYGADSQADVAALGAGVALGLVAQVIYWVRSIRMHHPERIPLGAHLHEAFGELAEGAHRVLTTPTLVYVFLSGALISFGMNGIVGWGPAFLTRELSLDAAKAATLLGSSGLVAGVAGTLAGGAVADWWFRRDRRARVLAVALSLVAGSLLAAATLLARDLATFRGLFMAAFFFLSWNQGPLGAIIFDVVPARVGATVAGAYYLFIHLAGDAIAMPLVGFLSDTVGLARAVMLLPLVSLVGGVVMFGAAGKVVRDMDRIGAVPAPLSS